ncbi:MAG: Brp/Blh family beta-carotene 15,15'-dioxygenase, partial [Bacteroidota bacterium]
VSTSVNANKHVRPLNKIILGVTVVVTVLGLVLPKIWIDDLLTPIAFLLILAGIPHGASDFVIFQQLLDKRKITQQIAYFGIGYTTITVLYLCVWWISPFSAFLLFLINSIYHFGESNWNYLKIESRLKKSAIYSIWGAAVLGVPVLLHFEEAAVIIQEITGTHVVISTAIRASLIFLLCFGNLVAITTLLEEEHLETHQFYREIRHFLLLMLLFFCTPLLIGFSVYFVFWHSIYAVKDQFNLLELARNDQRKKAYIRQVLVISLISFVGVGVLYIGAHNLMNQGYNLGKLFVFIAVITVPHSLLMHYLYQFKVFQEKNDWSELSDLH